MKKLTQLEKVSVNAQYARKESIELHGFDPDPRNNIIENQVLGIINNIRSDDQPEYTPNDIQACHQLKKRDKLYVNLSVESA